MSHCFRYNGGTTKTKELTTMKIVLVILAAIFYLPLGVILALAKSFK